MACPLLSNETKIIVSIIILLYQYYKYTNIIVSMRKVYAFEKIPPFSWHGEFLPVARMARKT